MHHKVLVTAPASSANLGPGFDVFALALQKPSDRLRITAESSPTFRLKLRVASDPPLSSSRENAAYAVSESIAKEFGVRANVTLTLEKGVPVGVGLGSSAASGVAAAVGMNRLFGLKMNDSELLLQAGRGELVSSGTVHYDNVAASFAGGFVIVSDGKKPVVRRFAAPTSMRLCLVTPTISLPPRKTEFARSILPKQVELRKLVHNLSMASLIVYGFARGDIDSIGEGMRDEVIEPARSGMIPAYEQVRSSALRAGASGVCISGAGPSMLAVIDQTRARPARVLDAMLNAFKRSGVSAEGFVTVVGDGARVVEVV